MYRVSIEIFYDNCRNSCALIDPHQLANFYCQYADRHMNLKFMRVRERESAIRQIVIVKNQIDVSF